MSKIIFNTFRPLCFTKFGREEIRKYNLPPFVDGSCRREPDFESEFPSITSICRVEKFARRLFIGDEIIYLTVQKKYKPDFPPHYKLISILEVIERFENHYSAASWYHSRNLQIPNNCLLCDNPPKPISKTFGSIPEKIIRRFEKYPEPQKNKALEKYLNEWDKEYWDRVDKYPVFLVCKTKYLELNEPQSIFQADLKKIFGRVPGTQNPPAISRTEYESLCNLIRY